ncbi:MAG: L-seryl-tRNA(Sec) selenium transferase [Pirellulales bacterium]|nr:L-seryl-tRNA(Sec) selenium transferase [Pirellulales bacterium]
MPKEPRLESSVVSNPYRRLPAVNDLLDAPGLVRWVQRVPRESLVAAVRLVLAQCREEISVENGQADASLEVLANRVDAHLEQVSRLQLREVINGTGVLIHTGLGRAPLSNRALSAVAQASSAYTPLELKLASGDRGQRADVVREQLCSLTGAESATVVNNNAAALLITLGTLAAAKQVIVSRGELIEIGGSFRLPDVMAASGAQLHEVGTTNKTRLSDYASAIKESTAALLKVHPSNYHIAGYTQSVSIADLAALGQKHNLPVIHDIGSGALFDTSLFGIGEEPAARTSIEAGADLVLFSGDKLVGGPQAGVIVGRRKFIDQIERNPLMRALRVDKLTLAALSATLEALGDPRQAACELPIWMMVTTSIAELRRRAEHMVAQLRSRTTGLTIGVMSTTAYLGGGSLPGQVMESVAITLGGGQFSEETLARRLRLGNPAVVGRLQNGCVLVDLRAVLPRQDEELIGALIAAMQG